MESTTSPIHVVDLFCGVGGLTRGLLDAGLRVAAGIDCDEHCRFPFEKNTAVRFVEKDVRNLTAPVLRDLWPQLGTRVLAGCAPCQPFSSYSRGVRTDANASRWSLVRKFVGLAERTLPCAITMENVIQLRNDPVFEESVRRLKRAGYHVTDYDVFCPDYGLPQRRTRLVLFASLLGPIALIPPTHVGRHVTVFDAIAHLPKLSFGEAHPDDDVHMACGLSARNLRRIRASRPNGTWRDWKRELRAGCHIRESGKTYPSVYGRMAWSEPAPTMTTQCYAFGSGRFGHPEQDRAISLREAAILQGFPESWRFVEEGKRPSFRNVGRMIGNAVPVPLGHAIGLSLREHLMDESVDGVGGATLPRKAVP